MTASSTRDLGVIVIAILTIVSVGAVGGLAHPGTSDTVASVDSSGPSATAAISNPVRIEGNLTYGDGTAVDNMTVVATNDTTGYANRTSAGRFSIEVAPNATYALFYQQHDPTTPSDFPRDGNPDVHALANVSVGATDEPVGDLQLPNASLLNVTVANRTGAPLENATVSVVQSANGARAFGTAVTDANGNTTWTNADQPGLELVGDVALFVNGPAGYGDNVTELTVTSDRSIVVTLESIVAVSGQLDEPDGSPAAGDVVDFDGRFGTHDDFVNVTNDRGEFAADLLENGTYDVSYRQLDPTNNTDIDFPKDGTVDLAVLDRVSFGTDQSGLNGTLPVGHNLTVTVVNGSGHAAPNATVHVVDHTDIAGTEEEAHTAVTAATNRSGDLVYPTSDGPGFEVNGTTHVEVEPPAGSQLGRNVTTIDVSGDRHLIVTLQPQVDATGTVAYANGSAPAGYRVSLWGPADAGDTETVEPDGSFSLQVPTNRTYRFGFEQTDWEDPKTDFPRDGNPDVHAFQTVEVNDINVSLGSNRLPVGNLLNVTVEGGTGDPVAGVPITVEHRNNNASAYIHGETTGSGELLLERSSSTGVEANGTVVIHAEPSDAGLPYADQSLEVAVTTNTTATITLEGTITFAGRLLEADGDPAAADQVHWHGHDGIDDEHNVTSSRGNFSAQLVQNATYGVAYRQDDPRTTTDTPFPKDGTVDVDVGLVSTGTTSETGIVETLPDGHNLTVTVLDRNGSPVRGATVHVAAHAEGDGFAEPAHAHVAAGTNVSGDLVHPDSDGPGFEVNGTTHVDVESPAGTDLGDNGTTVEVSSDTHLTVVLQREVPVNGTLQYNDTTPAAATTVHVHGRNGTHDGRQDITDSQGRFSVDALANRTYNVHYHQEDFTNDSRLAYPTDGNPDIYGITRVETGSAGFDVGTVTLPTAYEVQIEVVNATGAPVPNATVRVFHNPEFGADGGPDANLRPHGAPTNAQGLLDIPGSDGPGIELVGDVGVHVIPPEGSGLVENGTRFTVTNATNVTVVLRPPTTVRGQLRAADGTALANDTVGARGEGARPGDTTFTLTNASGSFTAEVDRNATYDVEYVQAKELGPDAFPRDDSPDLYAVERVDTAGGNVDLGTRQLPTAATLNVTVTNESGMPVPDVFVAVEHRNPDDGSNVTLAPPTNDAGMLDVNATGAVPDAPPPGLEVAGNVSVTVEPPANVSKYVDRTYTRDLNVTADTAITITLQERSTVEYVPGNHSSIQAAVDAVKPNGTVVVSGGTYNETVIIDKPLTLIGDPGDPSIGPNASAPVLDGGDATRVAIRIEDGVSNVTVAGFEVRNYTRAGVVKFGSGSDVRVIENRIAIPNDTGVVAVQTGNESSLRNLTVTGNVITAETGVAMVAPGDIHGVSLLGTVVSHNEITGSRSVSAGVLVDMTLRNPTIADLAVHDNDIRDTDDGLSLDAEGDGTTLDIDVADNRIVDVSNDGLDIDADGDDSDVTVAISGNDVNASEDGIDDIDAGGANSTLAVAVVANTIIGQTSDAIEDVFGDGGNQTVDVVVHDNVLVAGDDGIEDIEADGDDTAATVSISNNTIDADDDGIEDIDTAGANTTVAVTIADNAIDAAGDGIEEIEAWDRNQTVTVDIAGNDINASADAIYQLDVTGDRSTTAVSIVGNTLRSATGTGVEDLWVDGDDAAVTVTVADNVITSDWEGIDDIDAYGENTSVTVSVVNNSITTNDYGIDYIEADADNQTVVFQILDNVVTADDDAFYEISATGDNSTVDLAVLGNAIDTNDSGIDYLEFYGDNATVYAVVAENTITAGYQGIYDIEADGIGSNTSLAILNNSINATYNGIGYVEVDGSDQTADLTVVGNRITSRSYSSIGTVYADGFGQTVEVVIADNVLDAYYDGLQRLDVDGQNASVNVSFVGNDVTTTGISNVDYDGIQEVIADGDNETVRLLVAENSFVSGNYGVATVDADADDGRVGLAFVDNEVIAGNQTIRTIDVNGTDTRSNVSIVNNALDSNDSAIGSIFGSPTRKSTIRILENEIRTGHHGITGIHAGGSDVVVANNTLLGGGSHGVALNRTRAGSTATIEHNIIENFTDGVRLSSAVAVDGVVLRYNVLANNSHAALVNENGSAVNATRNWWGARDGPSGAFGGSGDTLIGRAAVEPFFIDAALTTLSSDVAVTAPSTSSLEYHSVAVGDAASKRFAVINDGKRDLTISDVRIAGPNASAFDITQGDASATLAPDEGVDVVVSFAPGSEGAKTARVVIESSDPVNPVENVTLAGTGRTAAINVTPSAVEFGSVPRGGLRTANVTVTNDGFASLDLTGASIEVGDTGAFAVAADGSETLVPGETNMITVAFTPDSAGPTSAVLAIDSSDANEPTVNVTLNGTGLVPDVSVSPAVRTFGDVPTDSSAIRTVTVSNDGNATLVVPLPTIAGADPAGFTVVSPGGTMRIAPGESRQVAISFSPDVTGDQSATLAVRSNDPDKPSVPVSLAGRGVESDIALDRSAIAFGDVRVDTTETESFTIANDGSQPLNVTGISLAGANPGSFAITGGDATPTLDAGQTHTVTVAFNPTATGDRTAVVSIASDDPQTPQVNVSLGGSGTQADINVSADAVDFDDTRVAGTRERSVTVSNDGNANLTVSGVSVTDTDFAVVRGGSFTLQSGEERNVTVAFTPGSGGTHTANLSFASDDPDEDPFTVSLNGTAITPDVTVSPEALLFGDVAITDTKRLNVTISNDENATAPLPVTQTVVIGPDAGSFSTAATSFTLAPGEDRNVTVAFSPQTAGDNKTATLRLLTRDPSLPQIDVWLTNSRTIVDVDRIEPPDEGEQGVSLNVTNASANRSVTANVSQPDSRTADLGVDEVSVTPNVSASFTANVTTDDESRNNFTRTNVSTPFKFIRVNQSIEDANLTNVSFVVRVSKVQLDRLDVPPEEFAVYRFHDGTWNELNVTLIRESRTHFHYLVESPGFSEFASGAKKPDFDIADAHVSVSAVEIGDTVRIITRITNAEDAADGTFSVELLLEGSVVDSRDVTIAAGGTRQVTFSRTFGDAGTFSVRVNDEPAGSVSVEAPAETSGDETTGGTPGGATGEVPSGQPTFEFAAGSLSTTTIAAGESVEVRGEVRNTGDGAGVFTATFTVNGVPLDRREVRVAANDSATVTFSRTFEHAGTFDLAIDGRAVGTLTVEAPAATATPAPGEPRAAFALEEASLSAASIEAGETVQVAATVVNDGDVTGEFSATLEINDVVVDRRSVTVPAGEAVEVTFERTFESAGTYRLAVGGEPVGSLTVEPAPTATATVESPSPSPAPGTESSPTEGPGLVPELPGFGHGVALIAVLAFALFAARRRS